MTRQRQHRRPSGRLGPHMLSRCARACAWLMLSLSVCANEARAQQPSYHAEQQFRSPTVQFATAPVVADRFVAAQPPVPPGSEDVEGGDDVPPVPDATAPPIAELEQLLQQPVLAPSLQQEVTTVSRQPSTVGRSPAAIYVLTNEMIRRSGVTSVPEALRMVPGIQVARIDSNKWAITARGFNGRFANKLLVAIDGRTVYTPVFAGTYWDVQDVVLDDIERIEVIRGPGATVWGANAVNGVINIITKSAHDTRGVYAKAGGGSEEGGISTVRIGGGNDDLSWRAYGKAFERGPQYDAGGSHSDDWRKLQGGFRMDWDPCDCNQFTVQGDIYDGASGVSAQFNPAFDQVFRGSNLLTRWTHTISDDSDFSFQAYYDTADRDQIALLQHVETLDIDFQHRFALGCRQKIIWGVGYRRVHDFLTPGPANLVAHDPTSRTTNLYSGFVQDEIELLDDELFFTIGTKLERNFFSGVEVQPSARITYLLSDRQVLWGSVSRAVRTPARFDVESITTLGGGRFSGPSPLLKGEDLMAYEIGYRAQPARDFSWDIAWFYNVYEDLESRQITPGGPPTTIFSLNDMAGYTTGIELSGRWQVTPCWTVTAWYSYLQMKLKEGTTSRPTVDSTVGVNPHNQAYLMSSWDLGCNWECDVMARYVDSLAFSNIPSYISMDMRLGWQATERIEVSVVGQNLLDSHHAEFVQSGGTPQFNGEIRRGVYGQVEYRY